MQAAYYDETKAYDRCEIDLLKSQLHSMHLQMENISNKTSDLHNESRPRKRRSARAHTPS
jgi:ABC-type uncharacterized transport system involved in gliding motility auxiliary subunit